VTRAWLVSGGGNDFLALVAPARDPSAEEIAAWCARGISVGADGLFTLRAIDEARVAMRYWNADGRPADLCLNGTRCAARLALARALVHGTFTVETGAGPMRAQATGATTVAVDLPAPSAPPAALSLAVGEERFELWKIDVGVPHVVLPWPESLARCPVARLGPPLRAHAALGPPGANVDFVRFPDPHRLEIRTFERGVEGETLACGTGILAAVATGLALGRLELPVAALTRGGFRFVVAGTSVATSGVSPTLERWSLGGDARLLGEIDLDDEASLPPPPPPAWSDAAER